MPSLYRRKNSQFWWAQINLKGKRKRFSTRQTDRIAALAFASALERELKLARPGLHSRLQALADEYAPVPIPAAREFLQAWLDGKRGEIKPTTHSRYTTLIANLLPHLDTQLRVLDRAGILRIRDELAAHQSPATVNLTIKVLRTALADAISQGFLSSNPAKGIKPLRTERSARRAFTLPELVALFAVAQNPWRSLILLGLGTGQRLNDLAELTWNQLDLAAGLLTLTTGKTGKFLELPLNTLTLDTLRDLPAPVSQTLPVFPTVAALTHPARSNSFRALLSEAGLATHPRDVHPGTTGAQRQVSPLSFHSLRHTSTTLIKAAGASQAVAQSLIGHDSAAMSDHYTHLGAEALRPAVDQLGTQLGKLLG